MAVGTLKILDGSGAERYMLVTEATWEGHGVNILSTAGPALVEVKTESDLSSGKVTFSEAVFIIAIANWDSENDGVFTVNGVAIRLGPGASWSGPVFATPDADVTVTGSTKFDLQRFV